MPHPRRVMARKMRHSESYGRVVMKRTASASFVVALVMCAFVVRAFALQEQHDHGSPDGRLGTVHFATSCDKAVAQEFDRGVALLHSFWFSAAIEAFNSVLKND